MDEAQITIRDLVEEDSAAVYALLRGAFGAPGEAQLVNALTSDGLDEISLVAEKSGEIIGHVFCCPLTAPFRALALAPLAVSEPFRKVGVGSKLMKEAHKRAKTEGWEAIFLLGDPAYYSRFGYSVEKAAAFECAHAGPYFMVHALQESGLPVGTGTITYPSHFDALG